MMNKGIPLTRIFPTVDFAANCPLCTQRLEGSDVALLGYFMVTKLICSSCDRSWWKELPYGLAALEPSTISAEDGHVLTPANWAGHRLSAEFMKPVVGAPKLQRKIKQKSPKIIFANCLAAFHGDSISLLLRLNQLRGLAEYSLVAMVPANIEWLVPDWVDEVWILPKGFNQTGWNLGLSNEIQHIFAEYEEVYIPRNFQPAWLLREEVESFTKLPKHDASKKGEEPLQISICLREDRCWSKYDAEVVGRRLFDKYNKFLPAKLASQLDSSIRKICTMLALREQQSRVKELIQGLHKRMPNAHFAVFGVGNRKFRHGWKNTRDLRSTKLSVSLDKEWMTEVSKSFVLVGVHGSHMVLPSCLPSAVICLMPETREINLLEDIVPTTRDARQALFLYRLIPLRTNPRYVANIISTMTSRYSMFIDAYSDASYTQSKVEMLPNEQE